MPVAVEPFGDAAFRARLPEGANGRAVLEALRSLPRVVDAVVTERHALVTFDPSAPPERVGTTIEDALSKAAPAPAPRRHKISATYDGDDLEEVARTAALSVEQVISMHAASAYVVAFIGFLPGFAYLRGLEPRLVVARRASPRIRIPPLSIGVAGPYTAIYPFASPGGWNIIGTGAGFTPFDPRSGATLAPGDIVRFVRTQR